MAMARSPSVTMPPVSRIRRHCLRNVGACNRSHRAARWVWRPWAGRIHTRAAARNSSLARGWAPGR
eukprot:12983983-Alexandrium_andersonii.AAC.1